MTHHPRMPWGRAIKEQESLETIRNPFLAFALGFFCGGIGLVLYLRTWQDTAMILLLLIAISLGLLPVGGPLWAFAAVGAYGFYRVWTSNQKICGRGMG